MIARISVIPGVSLHFILSAIFISKLVSSSFSHPSQSKSEPKADLFIMMNKAMLTLWSLPIFGLGIIGFRTSINLLPRMFIDVFYKKYIFRVTLVYNSSAWLLFNQHYNLTDTRISPSLRSIFDVILSYFECTNLNSLQSLDNFWIEQFKVIHFLGVLWFFVLLRWTRKRKENKTYYYWNSFMLTCRYNQQTIPLCDGDIKMKKETFML